MAIEKELKAVIVEHLYQTTKGNIDKILKTIHENSPSYAQTSEALKLLFSQFQLCTELIEFEFIGSEKQYAYVRAMQKITKVTGPDFIDCFNNQAFVFKKEKEDWKIWALAALDAKPVN